MSRLNKKNLKKYVAETRYLGEQIDLKRVQDNIKKYRYLTRDHPLVIQVLEDQYVVVTKFGAVTFWNMKRGLIQQFIKEISPFIKSMRDTYDYVDTTKVYIGAETESIGFEEVYLKDLSTEKIKILSYVSAQSVALDRYEEEVSAQLEEVGKVFENLKSSGKTRFSQKNLLKQVGQILSVKQKAISNLALFDKPDETWESKDIEELYDRLRSEYDLRDRFSILNEKIGFLSENNNALLDFVSSEKANFLELIIIVLIAIEIILFLPDWFPFVKSLLFPSG